MAKPTVLPSTRISHTLHRQKLGFSRVRIRIRVSVRIRERFSFSGVNIYETGGSVTDPGRGNTVDFTSIYNPTQNHRPIQLTSDKLTK